MKRVGSNLRGRGRSVRAVGGKCGRIWLTALLFLTGAALSAQVDTTIISPAGNQTIFVGSSVTFQAVGSSSNSNDSLTFDWFMYQSDPRQGESFQGNPITVPFNNPGTFTVECSAIDAQQVRDETPATVVITVEERPPVETTITSPRVAPEISVGESVSFQASATGGNGQYTFLWRANSNSVSPVEAQGSATTMTFSEPGQFIVSCVAGDGSGLSDESPATRVVNVSAPDPVETTITEPTSPPTVTVGGSVNFSAVASGGNGQYKYNWSVNGAGVSPTGSSAPSVTFTFEEPGQVVIICRASDDTGAVDESPASMSVLVEAQPDPVETTITNPTVPPRITAGSTVNFRATASGGNGQYNFNWTAQGGGASPATAEGSTVAITFNQPGQATVFCRARDGAGASDESPASIGVIVEAVQDEPVTTRILQPTGNSVFPVGADVVFTAEGAGGVGEPYSFSWILSGPDGDQTFSGSPLSVSLLRAGTYRMSCRAADKDGAQDQGGASVTFTARNEVDTTISGTIPSDLRVGDSVTLQGAGSGGEAPYGFNWVVQTSAGNQSLEGERITIPLTAAGNYTVLCRAKDNNGTEDTTPASRSFSVGEVDGVETRVDPSGSLEVELGATQVFKATASGGIGQGYSFSWVISSPEGNASRTGSDVEVTFSQPGTWRLAVTAADGDGNRDSTPAVVQVTVNTSTDAVRTIIEPAGDQSVDLGAELTFNATASGGSGQGYTFAWEVTSPFTTREFSGSLIGLQFTAEGVWTIRCVASDGAGMADPVGATVRVTVGGTQNEPVETKITAPQGPLQLDAGAAVTFTAEANGGVGAPYRFFWQVSGRVALPGREGAEVRYVFDEPGDYVVRCFAQDKDGVADETPDEMLVSVGETNDRAVETTIVSPTQNVFRVGQTVEFKANASGGAGAPYSFEWALTLNGEIKQFSGESFTYTFDTAGQVQVTCVAKDVEGRVDETPAQLSLRVDEDGTDAVDTRIVEPTAGPRLAVGESVSFLAEASGGAGEPYTFEWVLQGGDSNGNVLRGNPISLTFQSAGQYVLAVAASDRDGTRDSSPATMTIVVEGEAPGVNTTIVSPGTDVSAPAGSSVLFQASAEGGSGSRYGFFWVVLDGQERAIQELRGNPVPIDFPEPGVFGVAVYAVDGEGNQDPTPARAVVRVEEVSQDPLETRIVQPLEDLSLPIGERIELVADAKGGAGAPYRFEWVVNTPTGVVYEERGERLGLVLEDAGTYRFTCTSFDSGENRGSTATRSVFVGSSDANLDTEIVEPTQSVVETVVGATVAFKAVSDGGSDNTRIFFDWQLFNENGALVNRFSGPTVYVTLREAGGYRLEVAARSGDGTRDETPATRAIEVRPDETRLDTAIVEPSGDLEVAAGTEVGFSASHEGGEGAVRYQWLVARNGATNVPDTYRGQTIRVLFREPGDYSVLCQAVDEKGQMDTTPASRRIRVVDPDAGEAAIAIVEPSADTRVTAGSAVTFRAESVGEVAVQRYNWRMVDNSGTTASRQFSGQRISVTFPSPGQFSLVCEGATESGAVTAPVSRQIEVLAEDGDDALRIKILTPTGNLRVETGAVVAFSAAVEGGQGEVRWERILAGAQTNVQTQTGERVSWTFEQAGIYEVVALVLDGNGRVVDGDRRRIEVIGLGVRIVSPSEREVRTRVGTTLTFTGEYTAGGSVQEPYWYFGDAPTERTFGDTFATLFSEPGNYQLFFEMQSASGETAVDFRWIEVTGDTPLKVAIVSPGQDALFAVREQFDLVAEVSGAGDDPLESVWVVNGRAYEGGSRVEDVSIDKPGNYTVEFEVFRPRDGVYRSDTVQVNIYDPERALVAEIVEPFTDLQIQVGDQVYFEGVTNGAALVGELTERWEIVNLEDDSIVTAGPRLGNFTFSQAGSFEVRYSVKTALNESAPATRRIDVGNFDNAVFGDNDTPERAAGVRPGRYAEIALDRAHYFELVLDSDTQNLQIDTAIDGTADVTVFRRDNLNQLEALRSLRVSGGRGFTVAELAAGTYLIEFRPVAAGKLNLSFGFSVSVLTPSLFFADIGETDAVATNVGIVNPGASSAVVELVGYDNSGNIVAEATREIVPNGKLRGNAKAFFGDQADGVSWIIAQSTKNLQGYSCSDSRDGQEAYATSAATKLSSELYVPHIAQKTNNWYTRADIINGDSDASTGRIQAAGGNDAALNISTSFSKDRFRFTEKWNGALPNGAVWAKLKETNERVALAGTEVFGRVDGVRQVAGLSLADAERDNPNFTYIRQNLYFTHIARDTAQFWTGIALVNIDSAPAGMLVRGYGPGGELIGEKSLTLQPEEKIVELAEQFLVGIGSPANVDWVEIETDSGIVGYELFGTHDGARLAGFEASTSLKSNLCFPVVESGGRWQGISVINVNSSAVDLVFTLYSNSGDVLQTRTVNAAAKAKVLATVRDLFQLDTIPANGSWVGLTASAPIAGFELFGNAGGTQMSALKAQ